MLDFFYHLTRWLFLIMGQFSFKGKHLCCWMLCSSFELVDSFFGGLSKIVQLCFCVIGNRPVPLPRMIRMQICTAPSKSARFVYWIFYNFGVFILAEFTLVFILAVSKFVMMTNWIFHFQRRRRRKTISMSSYSCWYVIHVYSWGSRKQWICYMLFKANFWVFGL